MELVTFTEKILDEKLYFLCNEMVFDNVKPHSFRSGVLIGCIIVCRSFMAY